MYSLVNLFYTYFTVVELQQCRGFLRSGVRQRPLRAITAGFNHLVGQGITFEQLSYIKVLL